MKLSLAWIFDHIDVEPGSWKKYDAAAIVNRFNEVTAEIEHTKERVLFLKNFFLAFKQGDTFRIDEKNDSIALPARPISEFVDESQADVAYLVKHIDGHYQWAMVSDFGLDVEKVLPALYAPLAIRDGKWRSHWEDADIIFEVDNKSITHRPDMWGHRGFAREIAPFIGKKLKAAENFLESSISIKQSQGDASDVSDGIVRIINEEPVLCRVFNGLAITDIANRPCDIKIISRLLAVGARPMSGIVDLTNYVTLDWGQPVHAYDLSKITNKTVKIRKAKDKEELLLLDGNNISLTTEDLVIADDVKPMCLAGVKGGVYDSISPKTNSIFFEAANFDAASVRRSAFRHKTRTDSSARFEKTLDQNLAIDAVLRFLHLAKMIDLPFKADKQIISLGQRSQPKKIELEHAFLEARIGLELEPTHIQALLTALEFGVSFDQSKGVYVVEVPTFRASKDVSIKEDILEEVVRSYGFAKIPLQLPTMARKPVSLVPLMRHRAIKKYLAFAFQAVEMQNYALYDEASLRNMSLPQSSCVELLNPVSENFSRLISSLIPGLLKNVIDNHLHHDVLRFFESGKIWYEKAGEIIEQKSLAICFVAKRVAVDFYAMKEVVTKLLTSLGFNEKELVFEQVATPQAAWYKPYQTAEIFISGVSIGFLGKGSPLILTGLGLQEQIDASFAELNLDVLLNFEIPVVRFKPLPKHQETFLDFSFLVPLTLQAIAVSEVLSTGLPLVQRVDLIDFFEKEGWDNQRSLTFRVWLHNHDGTLDKPTIDNAWKVLSDKAAGLGAVVRAV